MNDLIFSLYLMAPSGEGQGGGGGMTLVFFGLMFLILYMFMIRPQVKKAKKQRTFQESLEKGDKIVTAGGIHGKIAKINEDGTLLVEVDQNVKLKIERSVVSMDMESTKK